MYQKLILVGNVGRDPEMRVTPNGTPTTSFSIATNRKYTKSDGTKADETTWFRVSLFAKQAESANQYVKKGDKLLVEGILTGGEDGSPRIWIGQDGKPRASFEVRANEWHFVGARADRDASTTSEKTGAQEQEAGAETGSTEDWLS